MAFAMLGQQDKLSESELESFFPDSSNCQSKRNCRNLQVCGLCAVVVVVILAASVISTNLMAKSAFEAVGTYAYGVRAKVGGVSLNAFGEDSSVHDVRVESPEGFEEDLMKFSTATFDVGFWTAVGHTLFNAEAPLHLEELVVRSLHVLVAQELDGTSNAGLVLHNMLQEDDTTPPPPNTRAMNIKLIVERVQLENISASISVPPISRATGPVTFNLKTVLLTELGKDVGGITLEELLKDVVRAVLGAIIPGAPAAVQEKLKEGLGSLKDSLLSIPHAKQIYCDAGKGLEHLHKWASNVASNVEGQIETHVGPVVNYTVETSEAIGERLSNASAAASQEAQQVSHELSHKLSDALRSVGGFFHRGSSSGSEPAAPPDAAASSGASDSIAPIPAASATADLRLQRLQQVGELARQDEERGAADVVSAQELITT